MEDTPSAELRQHPFGEVCPVGNGPFIFVQHRQGASWTFQANPAFPEGLGGRPFLDRYIYRIIVDPTTILTDLLTETIDVYIAPTPEQAQAILDSDALDLRVYPYRQINFVAWNARRPQLADKRVRQAITRGTDRRQIVDALFGDYARVPNSTLPSLHWAYDASIAAEAMAYDPEAAKALLVEAGWIDRDGDGVRENAQGLRLSFEVTYSQNVLRQQIVEIMQAQLAEIGIDAQPNVLAYSTLLSRLFDTEARDFDGVMVAFTMSFRADDTDFFHSDRNDGAFGFSGTQRPDMDAYLERLPLIVDREEAKPVWKEYQELLVDEQPWLFAYDSDRFDGVNKRLHGVVMDARGEWQNIKDWWIPSDQRKGRGR